MPNLYGDIVIDKKRCQRLALLMDNIKRLALEQGYVINYADMATMLKAKGFAISSGYLRDSPRQYHKHKQHVESGKTYGFHRSGLFSIEIIMTLCDAYSIPFYKVFEGIE